MNMIPCAACKYQRRGCRLDCLFASHFPIENIQRFACVHHVFGASNVANMLRVTKPELRDLMVRTLVYQAEARVRDPVYGCVGLMWELQQNLLKVKEDLAKAQAELAQYMGPEFVQKLSANFGGGSSSKGKSVALSEPPMVELDIIPSIPIDDDLDKWDPFPSWETTFQNVGPSSQVQHPHDIGANRKDKSVAP